MILTNPIYNYYEIYNEKLFDLLDEKKEKKAFAKGEKGDDCFIQDAVRMSFNCDLNSINPENYFAEFLERYENSKKMRTVRETDLNYSSSRSHAVVQIDITVKPTEASPARIGRINLVDLAGSEHVGRSGISEQLFNKNLNTEQMNQVKMTLAEGKNINLSLLTLSKCIQALASKSKHIPYRESMITRILGSSLGGNCRTTIIVCCSPSDIHLKQTKSSLFFGVSAMSISNAVCRNVMKLTATEWRIKYEKDIGEKMSMINSLRDTISDSEARVGRYKQQSENFKNIANEEKSKSWKNQEEKAKVMAEMQAEINWESITESETDCIVCWDKVKVNRSNTMTGCGHSGICDDCAAYGRKGYP